MADGAGIEPWSRASIIAALPGTAIDVQTSYPLQGGGASPLGGSTPAPVTLAPAAVDRSTLIWSGGAWSENRAGQRVQLAILSDPVFNWTLWLPSEFIALDSAGKSYSTSVWSNLGSYSTEADREVLYRWTAKFSDPLPTDVVISVWRRPYSGGEFDTGIQLQGYAGNTLCANYTDELTLYVGDEIMFSIDVGLSVRHVEIFSHRVDNS